MQEFLINKNSTLPYLEIEPINDGRNTYKRLYMALQAANVTFSMTNLDTGIKKIANAKCYIVPFNEESCEEKLKIQYRWNKHDTNESGRYVGKFKITFDDNISMDGVSFPVGELIVPISDDLIINISEGLVHTL